MLTLRLLSLAVAALALLLSQYVSAQLTLSIGLPGVGGGDTVAPTTAPSVAPTTTTTATSPSPSPAVVRTTAVPVTTTLVPTTVRRVTSAAPTTVITTSSESPLSTATRRQIVQTTVNSDGSISTFLVDAVDSITPEQVGIYAGIGGGVLLIAILGIYIFRKWKLRPSRQFRQRMDPNYQEGDEKYGAGPAPIHSFANLGSQASSSLDRDNRSDWMEMKDQQPLPPPPPSSVGGGGYYKSTGSNDYQTAPRSEYGYAAYPVAYAPSSAGYAPSAAGGYAASAPGYAASAAGGYAPSVAYSEPYGAQAQYTMGSQGGGQYGNQYR